MFFFFQAEDGIRDLVRSRGLGDVYKRQIKIYTVAEMVAAEKAADAAGHAYAQMMESAGRLVLSLIHI